jgi:hypothetical protein
MSDTRGIVTDADKIICQCSVVNTITHSSFRRPTARAGCGLISRHKLCQPTAPAPPGTVLRHKKQARSRDRLRPRSSSSINPHRQHQSSRATLVARSATKRSDPSPDIASRPGPPWRSRRSIIFRSAASFRGRRCRKNRRSMLAVMNYFCSSRNHSVA